MIAAEADAEAATHRFRSEVREWLAAHLTGRFAGLVGAGGPGREHEDVELRQEWERLLGSAGWVGIGWPVEHGGRGASLAQQVAFHEEYARAGAPARVNHMGEQLVGPTLIEFGTDAQRRRFLPEILSGEQLWCQGYSEPDAGSDLASVRTRGVHRDDRWRVTGQKVWTSLAQFADWCFVLARTDADAERHRGLSYLLVPMRQPGVEVRPIVQITGTSEFNEVFFDDALAEEIVGAPGDGWRVALATLGYERGAATLGQQIGFRREFEAVLATARANGALDDTVLQDRITDAWIGLEVLRHQAVASLAAGGDPSRGSISKVLWSHWHRDLGELAVDVLGPDAALADGAPYELSTAQRLFLYSRADTIYAGSSEIQRTIIAERLLGLPRGGAR